MVEFRVLGDVEVTAGGRPLDPGHARQQLVLVALCVDADRTVRMDQLINRIWGCRPPTRSRETVYSYISRIRRTLAATPDAAIRRKAGGYALVVEPSAVDLHRFRDLVTAARCERADDRALDLFGQALGLWRAEAFSGLESEWVTALRDELERERYAVELDRTDLVLRCGGHAELVGELTARAAANPLDERLVGQLMLALHRSGRQADALRRFHAIRALLVEELGVEPDERLQRCYREILTGTPVDPAAVTASPATPDRAGPSQLPADVSGFTGRTVELAELDRVMADRPAAARISVISGTAGVGKTALTVRWAHRHRERFTDGQLYVNLRGYDTDEPLPASDALTGFLRALGMPGEQMPVSLDELAAAYRSLVAGRRLLVVLDNAGSAEQVRPLLPGTPSCAVLVTSRDSLAGLVARDGAHRLALDRLPIEDAVRLLESLVGSRAEDDRATAATVAQRCARLPLALRVAAELAAVRPAATLTSLVAELSDEHRRLAVLDAAGDPRSAVRVVFSWSYHQLAPEPGRAFRLIGLCPSPDLDAFGVAALVDADLDRARDVLDTLVRANLVREVAPGRYEMHDLLRAYAGELATAVDTEQDRREAQRRLFDFYLHCAASAMALLAPAEARRHPAIDAISTPVPPMDDAGAARSWIDAERATLVAACAQAVAHGRWGHATRLAAVLGSHLQLGGHYAEALAVHTHAHSAAIRDGDRVGQARALDNLGLAHRGRHRYRQAAELHERAASLFREVADRSGEAAALMNLGAVAWQQGRYTDAADFQTRALELFREAGDRSGEAWTVSSLGFLRRRQGRYREAVEHHRRSLTLFDGLDDAVGESYTHASLGLALARLGQYDRAVAHHRRSLVLFRETGDRSGEAYGLGNLGLVQCDQGRLTSAARYHRRALDVARAIGDRATEAYNLDDLAVVYRRQGHHASALRHHQDALSVCRAIGESPGEAKALNGLGETYRATGQPVPAREAHGGALELAIRIGDRYEQARAHSGMAHCLRAVHDDVGSGRHTREADVLRAELELPETPPE